jgi:hypothetical protein
MPRERVGDRLRNARIVLLASPPGTESDDADLSAARIIADDDDAAAVDEAVIALSRAVLAEGGTLAVRDDGYTAPLVAYVAAEYWDPAPIETAAGPEPDRTAPVLVYNVESPLSQLLFRSPFVSLGRAVGIRPAAVVLVGGGEREIREVSYWRERTESRLFFPVAGAGGAAGGFEDRREERLLERLRGLRAELDTAERREPDPDFRDEDDRQFAFSHYPLLMRQIVDDIIAWWGEHRAQH